MTNNFFMTPSSTSALTLPAATHVIVTNQTLQTPAGTAAQIRQTSSAKSIHPRLYFKFVKSKLTKIEQTQVLKRMVHLKALCEDAELYGQAGLRDELMRKLAVTIRQQEAAALGFDRYIAMSDISKFMGQVQDRTVSFLKLDNYPNPIPKHIGKKIVALKDKKIFDEFWILFYNPRHTPPAKSNAEKIREKDPILFGRFSFDPDNYYFVCDWEDEYCDLTLDKFCQAMQKDSALKKAYDLEETATLDKAEIEKIKREVTESWQRYEAANRQNFQALARAQEKAATKKPSIARLLLDIFMRKK